MAYNTIRSRACTPPSTSSSACARPSTATSAHLTLSGAAEAKRIRRSLVKSSTPGVVTAFRAQRRSSCSAEPSHLRPHESGAGSALIRDYQAHSELLSARVNNHALAVENRRGGVIRAWPREEAQLAAARRRKRSCSPPSAPLPMARRLSTPHPALRTRAWRAVSMPLPRLIDWTAAQRAIWGSAPPGWAGLQARERGAAPAPPPGASRNEDFEASPGRRGPARQLCRAC